MTSCLPRMAATVPEFAANPDWNMMAASAPLNAANLRSSSVCRDMVPAIVRTAPDPAPYRAAEPEVVVRRQVDDLAPIEPRSCLLLVLQHSRMKGRAGFVQLAQLHLQVLEARLRHPRPPPHAPDACGNRMTFPERPDAVISKASSKRSSGNRWVMTGATSTMPVARSVVVCCQ